MIESKNCWLKNNCKKAHCDDVNGCLILFKLNYLYDKALIPLKLRYPISLRTDADGTDRDKFIQLKSIQDNIVNFVEEGRQLYIYSSQVGNGKSSWAIRLVQSFFNKIWFSTKLKCRALFISVPRFLLALKDNISTKSDYIQHIKENILDADLVVWDDISSKVGTEFEISNLLSLIETRLNEGKANIYTSNISPEDLGKYLDIRLSSRIGTGSSIIELRGGDKRGLINE